MDRLEIERYIQDRWIKLCKNALEFKADTQRSVRVGLHSILQSLKDEGAISYWRYSIKFHEHKFEEKQGSWHTAVLNVRAKVEINTHELNLVYEKHERVPIERGKKTRWGEIIIEAEKNEQLLLDLEVKQQKDRTNTSKHVSDDDMSGVMPLER